MPFQALRARMIFFPRKSLPHPVNGFPQYVCWNECLNLWPVKSFVFLYILKLKSWSHWGHALWGHFRNVQNQTKRSTVPFTGVKTGHLALSSSGDLWFWLQHSQRWISVLLLWEEIPRFDSSPNPHLLSPFYLLHMAAWSASQSASNPFPVGDSGRMVTRPLGSGEEPKISL